jgi:hypothetical protein
MSTQVFGALGSHQLGMMSGNTVSERMAQPDYKTIFEIGIKSFPWSVLLHPVFFFCYRTDRRSIRQGQAVLSDCRWFRSGTCHFFFLLRSMRLVPDFVELRSAYQSGDSSIVKGIVENFHPAPVLGGLKESFSVHGVVFSYYLSDTTPCFQNDPPRRGPIRAGLDVQIYYKDGCIQRVDVRQ